METTLSVLNQLPETKAQIESFASQTIAIIRSGCGKPLELSIQLKALEETIKKIRDGIKDIALDEVAKHGNKYESSTAKIEIANVGVRYEF